VWHARSVIHRTRSTIHSAARAEKNLSQGVDSVSVWRRIGTEHTETKAKTMTVDLDNMTRDDMIQWLVRNDPNGCYEDEECDAEDIPRLTVETAKTLIVDQIDRG